jgi:amino acid adenylation domain-containing protein
MKFTAYEASSAQKRIYLVEQLYEESLLYNMPLAKIVEGDLEPVRLESAIRKLVRRHEALRTSFAVKDGEILQKVYESVDFTLRYTQRPEIAIDGIVENFIQPFDLSQVPLWKAELIQLADSRYLFIFDIHHIIADGVSADLIFSEIIAFYQQKELPPLNVQYVDFTIWQNDLLEGKEIKKQEEYWLAQFADEIPVLNIPTDFSRAAEMAVTGAALEFELPLELAEKLNMLAATHNATLFMLLLAAYSILLSKYSAQEDIVLGMPIVGRPQPELEGIVGMFVNMLALRNRPIASKSFNVFLGQVAQNMFMAFENQDYPFEILIQKLGLKWQLNREPLFDTVFGLQSLSPSEGAAVRELANLSFIPYPIEHKAAKFDLSWTVSTVRQKIAGKIKYRTSLFKRETIERLKEHYCAILQSIAHNPDLPISGIQMLSWEEREYLLHTVNDTYAGYPEGKTVHWLFDRQAARTPDNTALVFEEQQLSYRELQGRADTLAETLRERAVKPNSVVGMLVERSTGMIEGILGILKAGGAYLPIDPEYPHARAVFMLKDSEAGLLLTQEGYAGRFAGICETVNLESVPPHGSKGGTADHVHKSNNLAYVIYTSGTTGRPRGVMVEHGNVVNVVTWFARQYGLQAGIHVLQMSDYTFDASVDQIFASLLHGAALHVISKGVRLDIEALRCYIEEREIHLVNFVPLLLSELLGEGRKLESLRTVISGAEKLKDVTKDKILEKGYRLTNHYGPTECTIDTLMSECSGERVTLGKPISNVKCLILDRHKNLLPINIVGELYVAGAGIARGYLNRPELTAETFIENPYKTSERLYRSGDLGRWLENGDVEYSGRIDHQVKIRGFRIEPGEIENQLLKYEAIKEAVVVAEENTVDGGQRSVEDKYLCAFIVSNRDATVSALREYLSERLPAYMIPDYLVRLDRLPLTPNGKVDRQALPKPRIEAEEKVVAPRSEIEKKMVGVWAEVLGMEESSIGIDTNFFEAGGHSLKVMVLAAKLHRELNVKVPLAEVFKTPTIRGITGFIMRLAPDKYIPVWLSEKKDYYTLSSAQKRLYFLQQLDLSSTAYNVPFVVSLVERVEEGKLTWAFRALIARHESLRTSFEMVEEKPVQRVHRAVDFEVEYHHLTAEGVRSTEDGIIGAFVRPFDLSRAPLLRVGLIRADKTGSVPHYILMVDMHHIITDGASQEILRREFVSALSGDGLLSLRLQYKDFSEWQHKEKENEIIKSQKEYWLSQFEGEIPVLNLPTDYPRPAVQSFAGDTIRFKIAGAEYAALKALALKENVTLFMLLLSLYSILLAKLGSQEEIVVGIPVANRRHADLQNIIGMFVNTLALRHKPVADKTFVEFLGEVKERTLAAFENQEYPFEELVEKVAVNRDAGRNPMLDVVFVLQNIGMSKIEVPGLILRPFEYRNRISKFDLTLTGFEAEESLAFILEYCTKLFKKETIDRFIRYFKKIIYSVPKEPGSKISGIEIITEEEKMQVLTDFNNTKTTYPQDKTIQQLFEEQAIRRPNHIALFGMPPKSRARSLKGDFSNLYPGMGIYISYGQLNEKSSQMAYGLKIKGVRTNTPVGIMMECFLGMVMGILSILKAGGAYLPIDPDYPLERKRYMLADSSSEMVLTDSKDRLPSLDSGFAPLVVGDVEIDSRHGAIGDADRQSPSTSLAYILYTSGTTGRPKAVMVQHRNVVRLVKNTNYIEFRESDRILQTGALDFDASTFEIWGALLNGLRLDLHNREEILSAEELKRIIERHKITIMWMTSSLFNQILDTNIEVFTGLRSLLVGGEALSPAHINKIKREFPGLNVTNGYGPTENTTFSSTYSIDREYEKNIPIGRPIANSTVYIADQYNNLQPTGVAGELWVGGDGVARGYLNNPELTAEKFVKDPFQLSMVNLYRTGDLARWLADGKIEFLGRVDHQVKVRGFRIEPGEIERQLLGHEDIQTAVVLTKEDRKGEKYLCAYVISDKTLRVSELREGLSQYLPNYMIPSYFFQLKELPLTSNGKIDRKALPGPDGFRPNMEAAYVAPKNNLEKIIAGIWREVLKVDQVGIHDNFFELGGNSINIIQLNSKLKKALGVEVPVVAMFTYPTIGVFAKHINKEGTADDFSRKEMNWFDSMSKSKNKMKERRGHRLRQR